MELKPSDIVRAFWIFAVLIVPFMELKLSIESYNRYRLPCLNRTFYGIETAKHRGRHPLQLGLNRTFYGIETRFS